MSKSICPCEILFLLNCFSQPVRVVCSAFFGSSVVFKLPSWPGVSWKGIKEA